MTWLVDLAVLTTTQTLPHPFPLSRFAIALSLSLRKCSQQTVSETLDFPNPSPSLSLSLSLTALALRLRSSNPQCVYVCLCVHLCWLIRSSLSLSLSLVQVHHLLTIQWRKASSIYRTISSYPSRPIIPGPPKVLLALPLYFFIFFFIPYLLFSMFLHRFRFFSWSQNIKKKNCVADGCDRFRFGARLGGIDLERPTCDGPVHFLFLNNQRRQLGFRTNLFCHSFRSKSSY